MTASAETLRVDVAEFDLPGAEGGGGAAALCLHGLTGTPYEVRALGEALARRGIRARGPALPGHNESPERLARVRHTQWIEAVEQHVQRLRADSDCVFVVGLSMGGLLALELAASDRVDAVVTVGTPLWLHFPLARLIPLLKHLRPMLPKRRGSDICDDAARARHPSYDVMPLHAVHELQRLQRRVRERLERVTAPILVAHGALDRTAHPGDARVIHRGVGSRVRELMYFESSAHVVPVDRDGPQLAAAVGDFLARYAGGPPA